MQLQMPCLWRWMVLLWATLLLSPHRATGNPFIFLEGDVSMEDGSGNPGLDQTIRGGNGNPCLVGQDVFSTVKENSMMGEFIAEYNTDLTGNDVVWTLTGEDADWFFLEGRKIRLNASLDKVLDREVQGPVLTAALTCFEEDTVQSEYRIMVEILNENDNTPEFVESTIQPRSISELAEVNTVVLTVQATDADDDTIMYYIDQTSPDAAYFRVDLPNSGEEMNTAEKFNTSANLTVNILDGDDQYPQFLPCTPLSNNQSNGVCTNPVYTVNITEDQQDILLDFSPGPINAVDGDRGLSSPVSYSILSGADNGRFVMDELTGEMRLIRGVENRLQTPTLLLRVMAYQRNDPRKYSVATVVVRVVAVNSFPPQFNRAEYRGFVTEGNSPASLVNTYGNTVLLLKTQDRDFSDGINPKMHYSLRFTSNHTQFFHITQEGLLIAKTNQLRPSQKHSLMVVAVDLESGDMATALVKVEVLYEGQTVPQGPLGDERPRGSCAVGKAMGVVIVGMTLLGCALYALQHALRTYKGLKDPEDRGCIAQGKHPNVRLQWFQLVSHSTPVPVLDEVKFKKDSLSTSTSKLLGSQSIYTPSDSDPSPLNAVPIAAPPTTCIQNRLPITTPTDPSHGPVSPNSTQTPAKTATSEAATTSIQPLGSSNSSTLKHNSPILDQMDTTIPTRRSPILDWVEGTARHTSLTQPKIDTPSPPPMPIDSPPHPTPPPTSPTTSHPLSNTLGPIHTPGCAGDTHTPLPTLPSPELDKAGTPPPKATAGKAHTLVRTTPSPELVGPPGSAGERRPSTNSPETASIGDDDCFLGDEEAIRTSDEDEELVRLHSRLQPTFLITDYDSDVPIQIHTSSGVEETGDTERVEADRERTEGDKGVVERDRDIV
ncbi:cadherin-related family member 5 isoform X2 [Esox lucius]|uniref:cadherin-related family member 5 isoform X2 n=1 Tax=Esox lucius TaxID=8010 RepID=UPI0014773550|nr:cadherin-related family member 5 isoform X2 [Esox lucius]